MLVIVLSEEKSFRKKYIETIFSPSVERVLIDDSVLALSELEQYLYPSLFSESDPIVHAQFMLENVTDQMTAILAKKFIASPTVFLFEEITLPTPFLTSMKKYGALVHAEKKEVTIKKNDTLFSVASTIIVLQKKDRWMNFQKALSQYPIEGLLGIMYWKVRDMIVKQSGSRKEFQALYTNLLKAHAKAWQTNTPLELMIEKVLLE